VTPAAVRSGRHSIIGRADDHDTAALEPAFPIAAAGCLDNRVERAHGSHHQRKIEIYSRLDNLRRDEQARSAAFKTLADILYHRSAVGATEERREVKHFRVSQRVEHRHRVCFRVQDDERLSFARRELGDLVPAHVFFVSPLVPDPSVAAEEVRRIRGDLSCVESRKSLDLLERRLRGGREDNGRAVVRAELRERVENWLEQARGQRLGLVDQDHALRQAVDLSTRRRPRSEETLEKLDRRCHDDRSVPIFCRKSLPELSLGIALVADYAAVVFEDYRLFQVPVVVQRIAHDARRLLGDAYEGNRDDYSLESVLDRVPQGEPEPRECLSAAGRDSEPE
jgi:hypothetical protein